jgi:hypothetical protein
MGKLKIANVSEVTHSEADPLISADFVEMDRRKQFLSALMSLTEVRADQLATRSAHAAGTRGMYEFQATALMRILGVLSASVRVNVREWKLVLSCISSECRAILKAELDKRSEPSGISALFNRSLKRQAERRTRVLSACLHLSGLRVDQLAPRAVHAGFLTGGEFLDAAEVEQFVNKVMGGDARLTDAQWRPLLQVFVNSALQALDREEATLEAERLNPDPIANMSHHAMLISAAMEISGMTQDRAVQHVLHLAKSFGVESLLQDVGAKLSEVIAGRLLLTDSERVCVLRPILSAAERALAELLTSGALVPMERFVALVRGCLKISGTSLDEAANMIARHARRWFAGRLESEIEIKRHLLDWCLTAEEQRIVAQSLFIGPRRTLQIELELLSA